MKGTETTREIVILDLVGGPAFVGNAYSHSPVDNLNLYSLLNFDDGLWIIFDIVHWLFNFWSL